MKLLTIAALVFGIHFSAEASQIACNGQSEDMNVRIKATWIAGTELKDILFFSADGSAHAYKNAPLVAYHPRNPAYAMMNRFLVTSDGWSETSILLPKTSPTAALFDAYYYDQGHSGTGTVLLKCTQLKN